jgi:outer membrane protein assembly factor BamB
VANTCTGWTHRALGDIDGTPTLNGGHLYVGNNAGTVYALDAASGATLWSFNTSDGPIKGFVFPDRFSTRIYFTTNTKVWGLTDNGASGTLAWPAAVTLPGPSVALFTPGGTDVIVGASDGKLYQLDVTAANPTTAPVVKSVVLGDGTAAVGTASLDTFYDMAYVGSDAGIVYGVTVPLP